MRGNIRAILRQGLLAIILILGVVGVALANLVSVRVRQYRLAQWVVVGVTRLALAIYNVKLICPERERIRRHQGLIVINHLSVLDAVGLFSLGPARCLIAAEIRDYPLMGRIAEGAGYVFVQRTNKGSRAEARTAIVDALRCEPELALVIAPEGKFGPGDRLLPFRHGTFAIAADNGLPVLLCAIRYTPLEVAICHGSRGETLSHAIWRLGQFAGPLRMEISPVDVLYPHPGDDPAQLAEQAHHTLSMALDLPVNLPASEVVEPLGVGSVQKIRPPQR